LSKYLLIGGALVLGGLMSLPSPWGWVGLGVGVVSLVRAGLVLINLP
jgi:hypothetical protein